VYDQVMKTQIEEVQKKSKIKTLDDLLYSGNTWTVD
jgi:hypothetical protein